MTYLKPMTGSVPLCPLMFSWQPDIMLDTCQVDHLISWMKGGEVEEWFPWKFNFRVQPYLHSFTNFLRFSRHFL